MKVTLDSDLERRIMAEAQAMRCTPAEVIKRAFERYEAEKNNRSAPAGADDESVYEAFMRAGLIGCIKDGPNDLSTNSKYMEGFGLD